jgi:hypothetical protein
MSGAISIPSMNDRKVFWSVSAVVAVAVGAAILGRSSKNKKVVKEEETWESHVNPKHGSLETVFPEMLYRLEAPGCEYGPPTRNMTIYRVPVTGEENEHKLLIFNAIAVQDDTLQDILKLGIPSVMVVPNDMHRCCAGVWKKRFPDLQVVCPSQACPRVEQVVPVDCSLTDWAARDSFWKKWITVRHIDGWDNFEHVLEVKLAGNKMAMIVCDTLFTVRYDADAGLAGKLIQWIFDSYVVDDNTQPGTLTIPKISRIARIFVIHDWKQAEAWFRSNAGESIYAILVGHGRIGSLQGVPRRHGGCGGPTSETEVVATMVLQCTTAAIRNCMFLLILCIIIHALCFLR